MQCSGLRSACRAALAPRGLRRARLQPCSSRCSLAYRNNGKARVHAWQTGRVQQAVRCVKRAPAPCCGRCRAARRTRAPAVRPGRACAVTPAAAARAPRARRRPPAAAATRARRRQSPTAAGAAARGWSACTAQGAAIMLVADALRPTLGAQAALAETAVTQEGGRGATRLARQAGRPASCLERHNKTGLQPGTRSSRKGTQSLQGAARLEHVAKLGAAQLAGEGIFCAEVRHVRTREGWSGSLTRLQDLSRCASESRPPQSRNSAARHQALVSYSIYRVPSSSSSCTRGLLMEAGTSPAPHPSGQRVKLSGGDVAAHAQRWQAPRHARHACCCSPRWPVRTAHNAPAWLSKRHGGANHAGWLPPQAEGRSRPSTAWPT